MFEAYWREYVDAKIAEQYYLLYIHHSKRWQFRINAFCLVVSFTGVATWISDMLNPVLASLIILVSQIISILQPQYPHGDRLYAANCIFNEIKPLVSSAEQNINLYLYGSMQEDEIHHALERLRSSIDATESKFSTPDLFPPKKRLHKKAEKTTAQYLKTHFDLGGWYL